jgi:hypothetical protein
VLVKIGISIKTVMSEMNGMNLIRAVLVVSEMKVRRSMTLNPS